MQHVVLVLTVPPVWPHLPGGAEVLKGLRFLEKNSSVGKAIMQSTGERAAGLATARTAGTIRIAAQLHTCRPSVCWLLDLPVLT